MSLATTAEVLRRFHRWYASAERRGQILPETMALATVGEDGAPAVRFVLLKGADEDGFVFYTNLASRKGRELAHEPRAALAFHWNAIRRQVRVEGTVTSVTDEEADLYWASRPRGSRLAAIASRQSETIRDRNLLVREVTRLKALHRGGHPPRPGHWSGYRLEPRAIEFWTHRDHRLHERELFTRTPRGWRVEILQP